MPWLRGARSALLAAFDELIGIEQRESRWVINLSLHPFTVFQLTIQVYYIAYRLYYHI